MIGRICWNSFDWMWPISRDPSFVFLFNAWLPFSLSGSSSPVCARTRPHALSCFEWTKLVWWKEMNFDAEVYPVFHDLSFSLSLSLFLSFFLSFLSFFTAGSSLSPKKQVVCFLYFIFVGKLCFQCPLSKKKTALMVRVGKLADLKHSR